MIHSRSSEIPDASSPDSVRDGYRAEQEGVVSVFPGEVPDQHEARELYHRQYKLEMDRFINPGEDFTPEPEVVGPVKLPARRERL